MAVTGEHKRILLTLEYDGTDYCGWQRQSNGPSIQEELEKVLKTALQKDITVMGASRTDAGVHAAGQCAHFDTVSTIPADKYPFLFNALLPRDITVSSARIVLPALHARFSAIGKTYTYRIDNRRQPRALKERFYSHVPLLLDENSMQSAADLLKGTHDFAAFAAAGGKTKTTVRTLENVAVTRSGHDVIITVRGTAFLYNMVRIIAGTLIRVGLGKLDEATVLRALGTRNRLLLGPTADACGLELTRVHYEGMP